MHEELRRYREFATEIAFEAGRLTLGYFQTGVRTEYKDDESEVTIADRRAEDVIRGRIEESYPAHDIVGEERADRRSGASHRWTIDPIDGTRAFVHGVPLYAVLIGLEVEDLPAVGAVYFPALDEMLHASRGGGCLWNGRRARVSEVPTLKRSIVCFTDSKGFERYERAEEWERLQRVSLSCRGWSDAYGHALVATGRAELMLDPAVNPWDCAPFPVILGEAGGFCGDWFGRETIHGGEAISTTKTLLPEVLSVIEGREREGRE